jgi:hypothetical protein
MDWTLVIVVKNRGASGIEPELCYNFDRSIFPVV